MFNFNVVGDENVKSFFELAVTSIKFVKTIIGSQNNQLGDIGIELKITTTAAL